MTAPTRCHMQLATCGPTVAWLTTNPAGNTIHLCQGCLDWWLDNADSDAGTEPAAWGWTRHPAAPTDEQIAAALTDPRNRAQVSRVLHAESRRNPAWLREFMLREELRAGRYARAR